MNNDIRNVKVMFSRNDIAFLDQAVIIAVTSTNNYLEANKDENPYEIKVAIDKWIKLSSYLTSMVTITDAIEAAQDMLDDRTMN